MISSLQELVAPIGEPEFLNLLRTRTLTFRRGSDENRFEKLLDWDSLCRIIESDEFPPDSLRITFKTRRVRPLFYSYNGKVSAAKVTSLLDQGASLIALKLQRHAPALNALCENIRARVAEKVKIGAIVTTGSGGALKLHFDPEDLIVLQLEGSKRWRIYGPPVIDPVMGMPKQTPPQSEPIFDEVLKRGDFLFMPGGYWHHCDNGPGRSLHLGILITPTAGWHAVRELLPQLLDEEIFRVPLARLDDAADRAAHETALKARLIDKINKMSLAELLAEREKNRTKPPRPDPYVD